MKGSTHCIVKTGGQRNDNDTQGGILRDQGTTDC